MEQGACVIPASSRVDGRGEIVHRGRYKGIISSTKPPVPNRKE